MRELITCVREAQDHQRTIAVDLDGTLAEYDGWKGHEFIGAPIEKIVNRVKKEKEAGAKIIIHTARIREEALDEPESHISVEDKVKIVQAWLDENEVPYDEIWQSIGKPMADVYLDDKAELP